MEYEILDAEDWLFDGSTDPYSCRQSWSPVEPIEKRKFQKAELIPEEEHQLA